MNHDDSTKRPVRAKESTFNLHSVIAEERSVRAGSGSGCAKNGQVHANAGYPWVEDLRFKVLGSRHCFNKIADTTSEFLSLKSMDHVVALNPDARTVTIESGMTYGQL